MITTTATDIQNNFGKIFKSCPKKVMKLIILKERKRSTPD